MAGGSDNAELVALLITTAEDWSALAMCVDVLEEGVANPL
jgi:hypothetical protein